MTTYNEYENKRYRFYATDTGCICESDSLKQVIKISRGGYDYFGGIGYIYSIPAGPSEVSLKLIGRVRYGKVTKRF